MIACDSNIVVSTHTFFPIFPKVKEEFAGSSEHSTPQTPGGSFYTPPSDEESSSEEISFESKQRRVPHPGTRRDTLTLTCALEISALFVLNYKYRGKMQVTEPSAIMYAKRDRAYQRLYKT